jgi:hypothetical protein
MNRRIGKWIQIGLFSALPLAWSGAALAQSSPTSPGDIVNDTRTEAQKRAGEQLHQMQPSTGSSGTSDKGDTGATGSAGARDTELNPKSDTSMDADKSKSMENEKSGEKSMDTGKSTGGEKSKSKSQKRNQEKRPEETNP